jgi:phosphohistidine phosphatase
MLLDSLVVARHACLVDLYLVQHGEATSQEDDPSRPLTDDGRRQVGRVARAIAAIGIAPAGIYHSGKLRAEQTAQILAETLNPGLSPSRLEGLAPKDDPALAERTVATFAAPVMLVGHLPHLSRLCSQLLVGDPSRPVVAFQNGGVVCLAREGDEGWRVRWLVTPEVTPPE